MAYTEFVFLKGKSKWVRHLTPNEWGKWSCVLYPDPPSLEKIRELQAEGLKNTIKKDEDGYYCTFSRPTSKVFKTKVQGFAPPEILDGRVTLPDGGHPPLNENVGNGSDVTIKLEVYQHGTPGGGKAKAARWLSLLVHTLVPYLSNSDMADVQQRAIKGLDSTQTEPLF